METEKPTASQKLNNWHLLTTKRSISREEPRSPVNPKTLIKGFTSSMKLLDARVNGMPRQVMTKYGEKSVLDVVTSEGSYTIWRPQGDREVMGRMNGERVTIALDSKGKASLVDHAGNCPAVGLVANTAVKLPFEAEMQLKKQMGFTTESQPSRSVEIADYIDRLGKLYSHCLNTAANIPTSIELEAPQIKDVATTMFIQTVRHFNL
jgi:hypothetical protein